jgi:hypothetical protein
VDKDEQIAETYASRVRHPLNLLSFRMRHSPDPIAPEGLNAEIH